jgi:protoheme IX farnesyltransferase
MIALRARQIIALSKPRIVVLLVFTAVCGMWRAAEGTPDWGVVMAVVVGGSLAAAGSNAINQGLDADIDATMSRTRSRPVPSQQLTQGFAFLVGVVFIAAAVLLMGAVANWLSALLTLAAALVYVFVYTMLLKRRSWNNIVIGGAAGAFPPLIGAAAVSGDITAVGLYLFGFVFFWTPPHFWTLSLLLKDDYAAASVPMLPTVAGEEATSVQVILYVAFLIVLAWLPFVAGYSGLFFSISATLLGVEWFRRSWPLLHDSSRPKALSAYKYSLLYLAAVFLALAVDPHIPGY